MAKQMDRVQVCRPCSLGVRLTLALVYHGFLKKTFTGASCLKSWLQHDIIPIIY